VRARGQGRTRRPSVAGLVRFAFALAAAALLAWLVVKTSMVDALVRRQPQAAALVAPDHPRVKIGLAMAEFRRRGGEVGEAGRRSAYSALDQAPLTEEPFFLAGIDALASGKEKEGEKLLAEARRRNPRARGARLILLDRYLRDNRAEEAGVEIAVLNRLIPRAAEVLVPELARMVRDPKTGSALIAVLRHDPVMQQSVLAELARSGADPDLILRIAGSNRATSPTPEGLPWQRLLLAKLIERGDVTRAHRLWQSFAGLGGSAGEKGLYDGRFEGLRGAPPFNWQLNPGSAGVAERTRGPALQAEYYGRLNAELAAQLMMLRPGRYRLQFAAEGDAKGEGSRLAWTVACHGSKAPLLHLPLTAISYTPRRLAGEFSVPAAGCAAQWLRLIGIAGEMASAQSATIRDMRIVPAGAR
jgi:hypothetical protein